MDYLVGIDLGSTNLKAIVYDATGRVVARASRPTQRFNPDPDRPQWAIWKPEQIWGGVADSLREATGHLDDPSRIRGVAVTGMGMDGVPLDAQGRWLYPLISWHCPRTEPQHKWWLEHVGAERQFAVGGNQIWVFNTVLRILWMMENEPEILARTHKWVLIEDFVNFMLCGALATDYSMASTTLLFDQRRQAWSDELVATSGIRRDLLCDPHPSGTVLGQVHTAAADATGLPAGTPVVLGGHDYLCGALPTGAFRPGVVCDVTGTWEMVVAAIPGEFAGSTTCCSAARLARNPSATDGAAGRPASPCTNRAALPPSVWSAPSRRRQVSSLGTQGNRCRTAPASRVPRAALVADSGTNGETWNPTGSRSDAAPNRKTARRRRSSVARGSASSRRYGSRSSGRSTLSSSA